MKLAIATIALVAAAAAGAYAAETEHDKHIFVTEFDWKPAPPSLPMGGQAALIYGDPGRAGSFVLRLKMPKGYRIPPHTHPAAELVTVVSGVLHVGTGTAMNDAQAKRLPAGSFVALEGGDPHYAFASEETVIQINGTGPFGVTYVNPSDDPSRGTR